MNLPWMRQRGQTIYHEPPKRITPTGGVHADDDVFLDAIGSEMGYAYLRDVRVGDGSIPTTHRRDSDPASDPSLGGWATVYPLEDTQEYLGQVPPVTITLPTPIPEGMWASGSEAFVSVTTQPTVPDIPPYMQSRAGYLTGTDEVG
jgi:hypothetical protein